MNFISICSGIEAASVAFGPLGWKAIAFSEIEPFPCSVLKHHYPDVPNFGDMTKFADWPEEVFANADAIVGGPPCQAFSVAGLRNGLADARGNLTLIYVELINHADLIRKKYGKPPVIALYENVPGIFSDKTNAYGCLLGALAGEDGAVIAPGGKWTDAGCVFGPERTIAWRLFDAQYHALAQRRRRVFVVASARTGFDPVSVLFEFEGVRRDIAPSRQAGQGTTHATAPCLTSSGRGVGRIGDTRGQDPVVAVITMAHGQGGAEVQACAYSVRTANTSSNGWGIQEEVTHTLDCTAGPAICCITGDITHTLKAEGFDASEDGTGRGTPMVPVAFPANLSGTQCASAEDIAPSMWAKNPTAVAFSSKDYGGDATEDLSPTLRAMGHSGSHANGGGQMAVAVALRGREGGATAELGDEVQNCLRASGGGGDKAHVLAPVAFQPGNLARGAGSSPSTEVFPTLKSDHGRGASDQDPHVLTAMQVRRLTPVECERLQGFPDGYTQIPWRKKTATDCPDGPRYKSLGNSWAVPNVRWIGQRIAAELSKTANKAVAEPQ